MLRSNSDPDLLVFDLEIERSLRHIRQVKHRIQFENTWYSQIEKAFSESDSAYSSASETNIELPSSDSGTPTMGDLPRITLKQMGGASMALENQPVRFPNLNENFELKSEAWKLIESVADNNQHFKTRATSAAKGVYEVAPSESTILAKSLVDIVAMMKEIKEGQQVTPKLLTQHTTTPQQLSVKHCRICSCNSHHIDECPQLQEDNTVAASHNFYENQQPPPNNR
ncbi:hypothetical protein PIB30_086007 [Stylosanthes scabra]|uniref:Uncharacterized protein n=1 Tax=Stylosanthes scabra TaxID=79078 RepID=A0ABU6XSM6_9FABA|nr:hypothetical protein [Stylosanthes scabra]